MLYRQPLFGGDVYAPNIYNKTQVDYIASRKQAIVTSATSCNPLNIYASGAITVVSINSDGTVVALNINIGVVNSSYLNVLEWWFMTPSRILSNDNTVSWYITSLSQTYFER